MFRFTIRDVLWLTALAAIAVAWWLDHRRTQRAMEAQAERIARLEKATLSGVVARLAGNVQIEILDDLTIKTGSQPGRGANERIPQPPADFDQMMQAVEKFNQASRRPGPWALERNEHRRYETY